MNIFFKVETSVSTHRIFGRDILRIKSDRISLLADNGLYCYINSFKFKSKVKEWLMQFAGEELLFVGYNSPEGASIIKNLFNEPCFDLMQYIVDLVTEMRDDEFGITSDFQLVKYLEDGEGYSFSDKIEMIKSHPQYPDVNSNWEAMDIQQMKQLHDFFFTLRTSSHE